MVRFQLSLTVLGLIAQTLFAHPKCHWQQGCRFFVCVPPSSPLSNIFTVLKYKNAGVGQRGTISWVRKKTGKRIGATSNPEICDKFGAGPPPARPTALPVT